MHVAILKRYHSPAIARREILTKPESEILERDEVWEVEEILKKRIRYNKVEYLVNGLNMIVVIIHGQKKKIL